MKSDWCRERNILREFSGDLIGRHGGAFLGVESGESLRKLRVAVALAGVGLDEKLFRGSEFGGEMCAIAAAGAPGFSDRDTKNERERSGDKFWPEP